MTSRRATGLPRMTSLLTGDTLFLDDVRRPDQRGLLRASPESRSEGHSRNS